MNRALFTAIMALPFLEGCATPATMSNVDQTASDERVVFVLEATPSGAQYNMTWDGKEILVNSQMGLIFSKVSNLPNGSIRIINVTSGEVDGYFSTPFGENKGINERYRWVRLKLQEDIVGGYSSL